MDENERRRRRVSIGGPLILISLGVVFLLNNLGVLEISVWELIFRYWPILLVAAGLDILLSRRSALGALVALLLTLALLAGAVWLSTSGIRPGLVGEEISYGLNEATQAKVVIAPAVGGLRVEALSDSNNLVEGILGGGEAKSEFNITGKTAYLALESAGTAVGPFPDDDWSWELGLTPDIPLDLEVDLGVGQSKIDLTGLDISSLNVSMGIGQTRVTLPDEGNFNAKVDGGIGEIIVVIPEGMAAKVSLDTGLVVRRVPDGYDCHDDVCTSPGYSEGADHKINLVVDLGIGDVVIRESGGR